MEDIFDFLIKARGSQAINGAQTQAPQGFSLNGVQIKEKPNTIRETYTVLTGEISYGATGTITLPNGESFLLEQFSSKAKWQYARLIFGRKLADLKYQELKHISSKDALNMIFLQALKEGQRPLQFIIKEVPDKRSKDPSATVKIVHSVASQKHSLISEEEVQKIIHDYYARNGAEYHNILGYQIYLLKRVETDLGGWKLGLAFDTGKINTDKAIRIGAHLYVEKCTNSVSFLNFRGFGGDFEPISNRILRITDKGTKERIVSTLERIDFQADKIANKIMENGRQKLTLQDAYKIVYILCKAYQIGQKVQNWLLQEFNRIPDEHRTTYELAMIISNSAITPLCPLKENIKGAKASLSTIAGIILSYSNIQELIQKCDNQLKLIGKFDNEIKEEEYKKISRSLKPYFPESPAAPPPYSI